MPARWVLWPVLALAALLSVGGVSTVATAATAVLLVTVALALRCVTSFSVLRGGVAVLGTSLRERTRRVGVLRHCDPDAEGHARPRAPTER